MLLHEEITNSIVGGAIEVHRVLGPGLLESAYEEALCHEFDIRQLSFVRQSSLPVVYKGSRLDCDYRVDLIVADAVIVELKAVDKVLDVHRAQLLTYLRLSSKRVGLLLNFNTAMMKDGIVRMVL